MAQNNKATVPKITAPSGADAGQVEVQARTDKAETQGFIGVKVDTQDNSVYTLAGVTKGK